MRPFAAFSCDAIGCAETGLITMRYVFGVDLGGTSIKLGLFGSNKSLLERWEIPTRTEEAGREILADIASALQEKIADRGINSKDVMGVGLGVPGAVADDGLVLPCVNLNGWGGFDAAAALGERCGWTVRALNDANAAALGEMAFGGGEGKQNIIFITLGTGLGGGIIANGRLVVGAHGAGGEIGHIKVTGDDEEEQPCGCGRRGCLEQYASATGIVRQANKLLKADPCIATKLRDVAEPTCVDIFNCAKEGDVVANALIEDMVRSLGKALAGIACVCDPEVIVVGGGVSRVGDILIKGIERSFARYAFPAAKRTPIVLARLGNDAGIYGAAQLMWQVSRM